MCWSLYRTQCTASASTTRRPGSACRASMSSCTHTRWAPGMPWSSLRTTFSGAAYCHVQSSSSMPRPQNLRKAGLGNCTRMHAAQCCCFADLGAHFCPRCRCVVRWHTFTRRASATGTSNRRWVRHQSDWRQSLFLASKPASSLATCPAASQLLRQTAGPDAALCCLSVSPGLTDP